MQTTLAASVALLLCTQAHAEYTGNINKDYANCKLKAHEVYASAPPSLYQDRLIRDYARNCMIASGYITSDDGCSAEEAGKTCLDTTRRR